MKVSPPERIKMDLKKLKALVIRKFLVHFASDLCEQIVQIFTMLFSQVQVSIRNCNLNHEARALLTAYEGPSGCLRCRGFCLPSGLPSPDMTITLNLDTGLQRWQKILNYLEMCYVEENWHKKSCENSHTIRTASNPVLSFPKTKRCFDFVFQDKPQSHSVLMSLNFLSV